MIKCTYFAGKKIVVFGLSRTGHGVVKSIIDSCNSVIALDDDLLKIDAIKELIPNVVVIKFEDIPWNEITALILSPGIPLYAPKPHAVVIAANKNNVPIISDIDLLYLSCPNANYIGITGTNGKSTTTALIGHIFKTLGKNVEVGGNIGNSVLELSPLDAGQYYVLELSSYQLDLIQFLQLDTALIINITPDHIDRHGSYDRYAQAKLKIMELTKPLGNKIASIDYSDLKIIDNKIAFSTSDESANIYILERKLHDNIRNLIFNFNDYNKLPGVHNEENIAAAYAVAIAQELSPENVVKAIKSFEGLKHRAQVIKQIPNLIFINDSKATNANASEKALECFSNIYWIAGGVAKDGGIESILPLIEKKVKLTLLIGESQTLFAQMLEKMNLPFVLAGTLEAALLYVKKLPDIEGTVLLSPACASYDQFKDFEHRGDEFIKLVNLIFDDE